MKLFAVTLIFLFFSCATPVPYSAPWQILFSGDEKNWTVYGDASWTLENGTLKASLGKGPGFVVSAARYRDFHLKLEFMPDDEVNSGVFVHCPKNLYSATDCYEFNIWDKSENQDYRTGSVVTRSKPMASVETIGQWNTYEIISENNQLKAWINGVKMIDLSNQDNDSGYIALQMEKGGSISFRNVMIKRL